ncbi:hypothetical protein H8K33_16845 [Undibacterium amnicola]|uniref:Cthe-2314-like HEPN domain-containing protein n=1 Tax=Undibacterium amnicola TaxID=1834038 RepID=A0ABR6XUP3_9BURK|nr:hypothetical protein [Undibacterium amnicola]MBC3833179.1 hypothetical protein [Undibacterium amnicola]
MKTVNSITWSDEKLRSNVERLRGSQIAAEIGESIRSINQRNLFLHYHFSQISDLLMSKDEIHQTIQMNRQIRLVARKPEEVIDFYSHRNICSDIGANIYGFIQSKHAVVDMLCYVICLALDYKPGKSEFRNFDFTKKMLKGTDSTKLLKNELDKICGDHNFDYLKELTNTAKHQRLVKITFDDASNSPQFEAFNDFPKRDVLKFLDQIHDSNGKKVINVLKELDHLIPNIS